MQQTDKYKLNKPGVDDPIAIAPLNENMDKVEAALAAETAVRQGETAGLTARVTALEIHKIAIGSFIGNGTNTNHHQSVQVGFTPKVVILPSTQTRTTITMVAPFAPLQDEYCKPCVEIEEGGFHVWYDYHLPTNRAGTEYPYVALY